MTTAKAISMLREKLGSTQEQFAKKLGVSLFSVSRYEGGRPPSRKIMKNLAGLAAEQNLDDIREFFERARRIDITSSYKNRASAGTGRHVPLSDLKAWSTRLRSIIDSTKDAMHQTNPDHRMAALMNARVTADFLRDDVQLYIGGEDPTHSSWGLQEDNERLKQEMHLLRAHVKAWEKRYFDPTKMK